MTHDSEDPMRMLAAIGTLSVLGLMFSPAASAQGRGHTGTVRAMPIRPVARPVQVRPTVTTATSTSIGSPRVIVVSPDSGFSFDDTFGNFLVPGLGFDFAHLAAINSGAGVRALIDPVTQHELALALAIRRQTPVVFGVFPGFFPGFIPAVEPAVAQPTVVVVQQPVAPEAQAADRSHAPEPEARSAQTLVEPAHEAGDFVLVRRDGGLLFAVAFAQGTDRITYVTKEGVRRSVMLSDLDIDATVRINEERGTPLQFPESLRR